MEEKKSWYAVYTKPRAEKKLKDSLDKKGIQTFLPILKQKKKWSDRTKYVETPVFPSYVFVKINFEKEALDISREPNSVSFVFFNGKPAEITESEIEILRIFVNEYPDKLKVQESDFLQKGREVEIISGPFAGRKAIVIEVKKMLYVVLHIKAINRILKVAVPKEVIKIPNLL
ncbi:MAG: UpxY family transcription antiterminator [Leptospiraceae bacterium]|nr:UpxY family transcription antiterminator [Leptospiraceae bacterium]